MPEKGRFWYILLILLVFLLEQACKPVKNKKNNSPDQPQTGSGDLRQIPVLNNSQYAVLKHTVSGADLRPPEGITPLTEGEVKNKIENLVLGRTVAESDPASLSAEKKCMVPPLNLWV